ncbi:MAG: zinc ribbon domain-containing protein [Candidatus Thorarchaeota archaeon]
MSNIIQNQCRRQLEYKCQWYGSELVIIPRTFPSLKMCSQCGQGRSKTLSVSFKST